jgi:peroxiredoxin Q/BCP
MGNKIGNGDIAPKIDLPTDGDGRFKLSDHKGKPVVIFFYPKDDTSGCTREAIDFTANKVEFDAAGVTVVGISPDSAAKHDKFKAKHDLGVVLASDEEKETLEAYGVWVEKSMYGRKYMGVERSTFLVGKDGKIAETWSKVKVPGHVEEVLAAARAL